ncbi:scyllo-inositol 2-dehydrogenase (NADP(+)) IolU [Paraglaciecola mesophila]|uniref:Scyllo-inositol 2-dehydrogenase (NADP(+)) IolU n=1 Tax=Paraglaciecola mesophila TaxID=197222 RepID=A0A857JNE6_9ALTE|nr:Gfo/Idh/MocA family oxidoreductase [Paraglaciecola mesophila]QHJ13026.1 scyllo-inositol 2-dehydrogenase (NADP(+)) IolU [Paraglaciecola mesophila]
MTVEQKVRWGVLGAGRIAHTFCKDIQHTQFAELRAVASRTLEDAQNFAKTYNIPDALEGYHALYQHPHVDAIYIATPHNFHFEQASAALNAGKHVLCEKPITVTPEQCQALIAIARNKDCFLMEGMWSYFLPAIMKAKEWVDRGRIGKIVHIKADFGYPVKFVEGDRMYDPALAGGCLLDMGIYTLAIAQYFINQLPDLSLVSHKLAKTGVEDDLTLIAQYPDATATLACSFRAKLQNSAYIIGENGYIDIPNFWRADRCSLFQLDEKVEEFIENREGSGFEFQIDAASQCILDGEKEARLMPLSTSLLLQQQMHDILCRIGLR